VNLRPQKVIVGFPVYNEAHRLNAFLSSAEPAMQKLQDAGIETKIIACVNGTTDGSDRILREWQGSFEIEVIESPKGKFLALQAIAKSAEQNPLIFADADIQLHEDCFLRLWEAINSEEGVYIAYPARNRKFPKNVSHLPFVQMQKAYYENRIKFPSAKHYNSRVCIYRNNSVFTEPLDMEQRVKAFINSYPSREEGEEIATQLGLLPTRGIPLDDLYISLWTNHNKGPGSIKQIRREDGGGMFDYTPPLSMTDYIRQRVRYRVARPAIMRLFPEFTTLHPESLDVIDEILKQPKADIDVSPKEVALIQQRIRLDQRITELLNHNLLGVLREVGYWTPIVTAKSAWHSVGKEVFKLGSGEENLFNFVASSDPVLIKNGELNRELNVATVSALVIDDEGNVLVAFKNKHGFDLPSGVHLLSETFENTMRQAMREEAGIALPEECKGGLIGAIMAENSTVQDPPSCHLTYAVQIADVCPSVPFKGKTIAGCCWMLPEDYIIGLPVPKQNAMSQLIRNAMQNPTLFPQRGLEVSRSDAQNVEDLDL
jgi:glycosyltransferase involved in cell wall biosynthesis